MRQLLGLVFGLMTSAVVADDKVPFRPLFNGKDLAGWTVTAKKDKDGTEPDGKATWAVIDGELRCTGKPTGYLATEKEYGDYVVQLKWRYPKGATGGNSGVLVHLQKDAKWWPTSVEVQQRAGRAGDFWLNTPPDVTLDVDPARRDANDKTSRHIWRDPRDEPVEKPFGEWNEMEITCQAGTITVVVNGRKVNEAKNCNLTKGRIGLQAEGTEIHFKEIVIRPLR